MAKIDWNRPATHEDANLLLRLYEDRREEKLRAARAWFASSFKVTTLDEWKALCPPGGDANAYFRMVTTYWEMTCSFVTSGVLHPELFVQNALEHLFVWVRVKPIIQDLRTMNNAPHMLRNLETVAGLAKEWLSQQGEGVYESLEGRFKP